MAAFGISNVPRFGRLIELNPMVSYVLLAIGKVDEFVLLQIYSFSACFLATILAKLGHRVIILQQFVVLTTITKMYI